MRSLTCGIFLGCLIGIGACMTLAAGCKKLVSLPEREEQLVPSDGFIGDGQALDAMNGILARCMQTSASFMNGAVTIFPGMSADEIVPAGASNIEVFRQFAENRLGSDNPKISVIYNTAFNLIAQINIVLENLNSEKVSRSVRERLTGECRCLRALIDLQLTSLFGDLPLVTITNADMIANISRTPVDSVYRQIILDLRIADSLLPASYTVMEKEVIVRTHPNKWVAHALLARVLLYMERWAEAESLVTEVLDRPDLRLASTPDSVFLNDSREILWQMIPLQGAVIGEAEYFLPKSAGGTISYAIQPTLMNAFEPGDRRKTSWTGLSGGVYYPRKYKALAADRNKECNVIMRLAELVLIRAEARAEQGDLMGAIADADVLRIRAGLPVLQVAFSKPAVLEAIRHEQRIELMCEWGHRWIDLKRTGQAGLVLGDLKPAWQASKTLYPLPASELKKDTNLVQNPGY